jgi:hypothetical protein
MLLSRLKSVQPSISHTLLAAFRPHIIALD